MKRKKAVINTGTASELKNTEHCPKCHRELVGDIELESAILGDINFMVFRETPDRNWIQCDSCSQTLCKSCCVMPDTGYCNRCYYKINIESFFV